MSAHKSTDKVCAVVVALTLIIALIFCNGQALGVGVTARAIGYENRIFDRTKVHTLDIVMNDWDSFIETCESEEYSPCNVVIDGEAIKNVGIRGKGNTSLSSVRSMGSSRYSFKIEFDQYDSTKSYHGLDKLCLNNIIQDNTYMKDYLAYTLMSDFGVDSPLCSYVYITVNGEDWGLYLAVESIEDSFLQRNYGSDPGELYKPDSMSFGGGGPGNGKDFSMTDFIKENSSEETDNEDASENTDQQDKSSDRGNFPGFPGGNMPEGMEMPEGFDPSGFDPSKMSGERGNMPDMGGKGGFGGMGSDDVKLKYIDDDIDSYSNIFNNAKTDITKADKKRLISSLKALSEGNDIDSTVNVDEVIRYFVVHNFLCNGDSYTGMMIHNYYLYEKDGQLSMIPWDYNLAYGSFQGGNASSSVNAAIDTPVSGDMSDRPMLAWIFDSEEYTKLYHELFAEFISSTDLASLVSETAAMIDEYVEKDPTKFCTYEEFQKGVTAMSQFCTLRAESVKGQLDGTIPSTSDGQSADSTSLIDTADLNISDMGSMGSGGGFGGFGGKNAERSDDTESETDLNLTTMSNTQPPSGDMPSELNGNSPNASDTSANLNGEIPDGFDPSKMQGGDMPQGFNGDIPEGFTSPNGKSGDTDTSASGTDNNSSRPDMGSFPGMNISAQKDTGTAYILLGVSAAVLLAGVVFALRYKR
ncbi:MAG: CotH kinase family protein [Oscillospiraceae bacterium]|nr:CotH kinase family protein [Oscillospiraceae bacterium]